WASSSSRSRWRCRGSGSASWSCSPCPRSSSSWPSTASATCPSRTSAPRSTGRATSASSRRSSSSAARAPLPRRAGTSRPPELSDPSLFAHPDGGIVFTSPPSNTVCFYTEYGAHPPWWGCLLDEHTVELPPSTSADCLAVRPDGSLVRPNGLSFDPASPESAPVSICGAGHGEHELSYGSSVTYRDMGCDSTEDGMTCRSRETGRGFSLSRSHYAIY